MYHNTELNVVVSGNNNHDELCKWFDALWEESQDFDEALMEEMKQSWALASATPYDIYMKTLYSLVKARLEEAEAGNLLWDDDIFRQLTAFQQDAVRQATGNDPQESRRSLWRTWSGWERALSGRRS